MFYETSSSKPIKIDSRFVQKPLQNGIISSSQTFQNATQISQRKEEREREITSGEMVERRGRKRWGRDAEMRERELREREVLLEKKHEEEEEGKNAAGF